MLRNYLSIAWRKVLKNKLSSTINIAGLCLGLAVFLLISAHVINELSYDNFYNKKDRIYRVQLKRYKDKVLSTEWAWGSAAIGPALKENFPEVENYVMMSSGEATISYKDAFFKEPRGYFASQDFFKVFSVKLVNGNPDDVLSRPYTAVVSKSTAAKYFKDVDPIGKTIKMSLGMEYEVTGVFQDFPENSHMRPDLLFSFETLLKIQGRDILTAWQRDYIATYVLLRPDADADLLESKIPALVQKAVAEQLKRSGARMEFYFMPLTDIHLDSNFLGEFEPNGSRLAVYFLIIIAGLIIVVALINHINLSTATARERAREIGLRKSIGSSHTQIIFQFVLESLLINFVALVCAATLMLWVRPWFTVFSGYKIHLSHLLQWNFCIPFFGGFLFAILLSGIYPAIVLSKYRAISALRGGLLMPSRGLGLRRSLVVFQFLVTILLITSTYAVYNQVSFMRDTEIGVNLKQTLVLETSGRRDSTARSHYRAFENDLLQFPDISGVATSSAVPGGPTGWVAGNVRLATQTEAEGKQYQVIGMDQDFMDVYSIHLLAGRKFSKEYPLDNEKIILNESAMRHLGCDDPEKIVDKDLLFWGKTYRIIGVVSNFHQESPKKAYDPILFRCMPKNVVYYSVKYSTANVGALVSEIENDWKKIFPDEPFDYYFLNEHYEKQYLPDVRFGRIVGLFSIVAIIVACIGLFGLCSLTLMQRTKEVGVRKVLGATLSSIALLIGRDFLLLIAIAIFIAVPVSWWAIDYWLRDFANRIDLTWWMFTLPSVVVTIIAIMTIAYHTLRVARTNPVEALKYE